MQYTQLSMGVKDEKSNKQLQQLLNEKMGAGLAVDGIFGPKTNQAVRDYQKKNGLQVDGIVGPKTWASLLGDAIENAASGGAAQPEKPKQTQGFQFQEQELYDQAAQAFLNREGFSYDLNADPLYRQYLQQYTAAGRMAMEDTMGRAAALTGGYGNSYAQTAGQQAYNTYLQQLNDRIPDLYELAYSKYQQEGDALRDRYELLKDRKDDAYKLYQDSLEQKELAYSRLVNMIIGGYQPTDEELASVGLTRRQAIALAMQ